MKLRQLEYFCAVAEEKSISAAARELHVAQPPISRQIAQLEEELGVQLFPARQQGHVPHPTRDKACISRRSRSFRTSAAWRTACAVWGRA